MRQVENLRYGRATIAEKKAKRLTLRPATKRNRPVSKALAAGFAVALAMSPARAARASELRVTIAGVRSDAGELLIGVYADAEGFRHAITNATKVGLMVDRSRVIGLALRAASGSQQNILAQRHPGRYAVIVIHDENDNGGLDVNMMGVPTEGYGFSNDAHGFLSAPAFEAAAVTVGDMDQTIVIDLVYPPTASPQDQQEYDLFIGTPLPGK
jgi:uncharacterized protein (DUF2141 family)